MDSLEPWGEWEEESWVLALPATDYLGILSSVGLISPSDRWVHVYGQLIHVRPPEHGFSATSFILHTPSPTLMGLVPLFTFFYQNFL